MSLVFCRIERNSVRYSKLFMNTLQLNNDIAANIRAVPIGGLGRVSSEIPTTTIGAVTTIATKQMTRTFLAERIALSVTRRELPVTTDCCCAVIRL